jgi:Tol biopolymer transport system component
MGLQTTTGRVTVIPAGTIAWTLHPENLAFGTISEVRLTVPAGGGAASWEPGKGRVVASRNGALLIVDTLGNIQALQTPGFTGVTWPEWSTDGWIYFHGNQGASTAIGRVRPDGTTIQTIAATLGAQMPTLSPDGNSLAYALPGGLVIRDLTTGSIRSLANTNAALTPRWSNDGQWIAFTVGQFGDLMVVRPDGTQLQRVAVSIHAGLTWSPDSRWILARGQSTAVLVDMTTPTVLPLYGVSFGEYPGWKR